MPARLRLAALVVAVVAATAGTALLWLYLHRYEQQLAGGPRVPLLMTLEPLERGAVLGEEQLAVREVPEAYVEDRFVRAFDRAKVLGLRLAHHVQPQQLLLWTDLDQASEESRDLSALVPSGSRAVSVRISNSDPGSGLVRPGDTVDVIANLPGQGGGPRSAVVLLQKALVLAVGGRTERDPAPGGAGWDGGEAAMVTLSVSLRQAQLLSLAAERGRLQLALRNPDDPRVSDHVAGLSAKVLSDAPRQVAARRDDSAPVRLEGVAP